MERIGVVGIFLGSTDDRRPVETCGYLRAFGQIKEYLETIVNTLVLERRNQLSQLKQ
ncbi:hypothetical protein D9M73_125420 [compost metagenome]